MRYFATFADTGERIMTFVADGMPFTVADILSQHPQAIEISEEDQALYMQGYVRGRNGKPVKTSSSVPVEQAKQSKINQIKDMAKAKLVETDHNIVEYYELKNLTDEEYNILKSQRQAIRDYRDNLIAAVVKMTDSDTIETVNFKL